MVLINERVYSNVKTYRNDLYSSGRMKYYDR